MSSGDEFPTGQLRTMQIITVAMILGVAAFAAVAVCLNLNNPQPGPGGDLPPLTLIACVALVALAFMSFIVPKISERTLVGQIATGTWPPRNQPGGMPATDEGKLLTLRQMTLIISLAFIEGPSFMGGVAYLVEKNNLGLGVMLIGLGLLVARYPTEDRLRQWLEAKKDELDRIRQERGLKPGGLP
jgi:hypothetical protein